MSEYYFNKVFVIFECDEVNLKKLPDLCLCLASIMLYENRKKYSRKMFRVLSYVIYTIISKYVCIDYLGSYKSKWSGLHLGGTGKYKHYDTDYNNVLGIGIPDLLLNLLSCHVFSKNDEYVVILKCPLWMSEYYFKKGFIFL